ncbi:GNAT family N-acetyltransferase [Shewanella loihica]|uniref:Acetyltransferase, GNAT family n=1 Tax=Shewanella loihica (strain ATCC BAA-1088 / PV-4) TaxID=323850 RepID=A3QCF6_SHELP|nr:GNAT family N-acetyltransferase [Shewanella loihica]ABO23154.1 Acetyltransferase, GNAT family [Shewanella loihica PV-4]
MIKIIPYRKGYSTQVSEVYHLAVRAIDETHYSAAQKCAWSRAPRSGYHWQKRLTRSQAWLAVDTESLISGLPRCVGFINVETHYASRGYIDSLYVHPGYQGLGIARQLLRQLVSWSAAQGMLELSVDASSLSRPLFLAEGFVLRHKRYQEKAGQIFMAYYLVKSQA